MYRDAYCRPRFSFQDFFIWASSLTMPLILLPKVWTPLNVWTWGSSAPYTLFLHWGVPGTTYGSPDLILSPLWKLVVWIPFVLSVYGLFKTSDDKWSSFGEHDFAKCFTLTMLLFLLVWKGIPAWVGK